MLDCKNFASNSQVTLLAWKSMIINLLYFSLKKKKLLTDWQTDGPTDQQMDQLTDWLNEWFTDSLSNHSIQLFIRKPCLFFVSCRHDVVMTTREYARGRRCIPRCIPCAFALWGRGIFPPCQYFSRHVKICFVRPPDFVRVVKEQIIFVYK